MSDITPLDKVGEFGLIRRIQETITLRQPSTTLGIGDDAAILTPAAQHDIVVSTDLLVEGVHFDLTFCPLKHVGYKAVAVNVSDIAAMNALPTQIVVGLAIGSRYSVEAIDELYEGMRLACEAYKVDLVGGDTTASRGGLTISITAMGQVETGRAVRRSGAQPNDLICVTGDLGGLFWAYKCSNAKKPPSSPTPTCSPS